jgi:hypothetical protein
VGDPREILLDRVGQLALHPLHVIDVVLQEELSEPVASMISSAWRDPVRKMPGMSKELRGSISSRNPSALSLSAANFRLATSVACVASRVAPFCGMPTRQLSCGAPSAFAYSIALPTLSWNSATRSGWQAMPRSPPSQLPGENCAAPARGDCARVERGFPRRGKHTETGIRRHETRRGGGVEALEEVELVVQHRQVGGELWHGGEGRVRIDLGLLAR